MEPATTGLAIHSEALGFDGFFVSDHYHAMGEINPRLGPTDAMTTLAGLGILIVYVSEHSFAHLLSDNLAVFLLLQLK